MEKVWNEFKYIDIFLNLISYFIYIIANNIPHDLPHTIQEGYYAVYWLVQMSVRPFLYGKFGIAFEYKHLCEELKLFQHS